MWTFPPVGGDIKRMLKRGDLSSGTGAMGCYRQKSAGSIRLRGVAAAPSDPARQIRIWLGFSMDPFDLNTEG